MSRQIFVNLPVRDLPRSKDFFGRLGFGFEPKFTDENAACMVVAENIYVTFTKKQVVDASNSTEVLIALSCGSDAEVNDLVAKAAKSSGKAAREPKDHGFMYEHAFEDPDGHTWELVHMRKEP